MRDVSAWVDEGRIKYREDVIEGLENAPRALIGLLRGNNFGKLPATLAAESDGGGVGGVGITFTRIIVHPDGHREIEGQTPKQIAPPSSPSLPERLRNHLDQSESKDLED